MLAFFDVHVKRILHLRSRKRSRLYYYNVEGTTAPHADDMFNRITDDWVTIVDRRHTEAEVVDAWATVARVERIRPKRMLQKNIGTPRLPPRLPVLPKLSTCEPTFNPLAEQAFAPDGKHTTHTPLVNKRVPRRPQKRPMLPKLPTIAPAPGPLVGQPGAKDGNNATSTNAQMPGQAGATCTEEADGTTISEPEPWERRPLLRVRKPVTPAEQLESELWAARLGFCGLEQLVVLPGKVDGIPATIKCHPFRYMDHKETAVITKRAAGKESV